MWLEDPGKSLLDGIAQTQESWPANARTIIALGDVIFSAAAVKTIVTDDSPLALYGRRGPNAVTEKPHGEVFAVAFWAGEQPAFLQFVNETGSWTGRRLWDLEQSIAQARGVCPFVSITDFTDDIDTPDDLKTLPLIEREMGGSD